MHESDVKSTSLRILSGNTPLEYSSREDDTSSPRSIRPHRGRQITTHCLGDISFRLATSVPKLLRHPHVPSDAFNNHHKPLRRISAVPSIAMPSPSLQPPTSPLVHLPVSWRCRSDPLAQRGSQLLGPASAHAYPTGRQSCCMGAADGKPSETERRSARSAMCRFGARIEILGRIGK